MLAYLQLIDSPEEQSRFEELYITYRELMFHVAKGILGNDQDAEDAVHDAFLSIAKNFDKISTADRHKTKAFVVIVVENKAINIYHHKRRQGGIPRQSTWMIFQAYRYTCRMRTGCPGAYGSSLPDTGSFSFSSMNGDMITASCPRFWAFLKRECES